LEKDMIRCGLLEQHNTAMARFRGGLNREIQDILDCKEYADMTTLFEHACKAEREVQKCSSKTFYLFCRTKLDIQLSARSPSAIHAHHYTA
jgi:hypothetical protein